MPWEVELGRLQTQVVNPSQSIIDLPCQGLELPFLFLTSILYTYISSIYKFIISSNCAALSLVILLERTGNLGLSTWVLEL